MKYLYSLMALCLFSYNIGVAQNYHSGAITDKNNQTIEGRVSINNNSKKVYYKKNGNLKTYNFKDLNSVTLGNDVYSKITFNNEEYLANSLVSGKASIYKVSNIDFLLINENNGQVFNLINDKQQIPGILSLTFKDCNTVRDEINKTEEFSENTLSSLTNSYNNCDYGAYVPTEKELSKANTYNTDTFRFYAALQASLNNTNVNNNGSNNSNGFGLGLGLASSPSFMGKLQGNIYINFDLSMIFSGDSKFKNQIPLNFKQNSYRLSLGLEYVFNKEGIVSPFLGIGYGYTADYYNGTIGTIEFKDNKQNYFFIPKAGILYNLKNDKHLGLTVSYISEYENNLSFRYGEELTYYPLVINNSFVIIGLSYYF